MRWLVVAALLAACGSSATRYEASAKRLVTRARTTSVFGPVNEYEPSTAGDTAGMFGIRAPAECEIAILPGGEDSFAARMDLLARATKSIRIEALIFTGDESGLRVAEVLKAKHAAGVDVKVIVDSINNLGPQTQWMYFDLKQHGIDVEGYEAMGLHVVNELPLPLLTPFHEKNNPNKRYHEKLWIIDAGTPAAEAVTGGLNIANEYFRVDPTNVPRYWRDQDVLVRGAIVDDLTATFDRNWTHFKARDRGIADAIWATARKLMAENGPPTIKFERRDALVKTVASFEARPLTRDFHGARCRFFQSRPRLGETYILEAYMKLLASAKREVLIANAYFLPTVALRMAIKEAGARCVRVVILSNGAETSDTPGMNPLARAYYRELITDPKHCPTGGGVEIWEWLGKRPGAERQTQGLLHAKYAIADRTTSIVGSFNFDPRSERLNSETAIVFENPELGVQLTKLFEIDLSTSRRISREEAATFEKPASVRARWKGALAKLFEGQL
jgi:cardiolipin synthase C